MVRLGTGCLLLGLPCAAYAQAPVSLHASYDTYAAGIEVAKVDAGFSLGPRAYEMNLAYHTTGMVGFFFRGNQVDRVQGAWRGLQAMPSRYLGQGLWRGKDRLADIEYQSGAPTIRQLIPPNDGEREPVPDAMRLNTIDSLSALMQLIRTVADSGRCETKVRTFDGRRASEIQAHTVGEEMLETTSRSSYAGKALHCEFSGRLLAGFLLDDDRARESKPMHGSAWMAPVVPSGPLLPVRMSFETRWFGEATMYLTGIGPGSDIKVARGN